MTDQELQSWVDGWSAQYPSDDSELIPLLGKSQFDHDDLEVVYWWKYRGLWPRKKVQLMRSAPEDRIIDLTRRAFSCSDELGAFLILTLLAGAGPASASAILMAQDPGRFTVMDVRAIKSLVALELWSDEEQGSRASAMQWVNYLETCTNIAKRTQRSLRTVDRALWMSKGR